MAQMFSHLGNTHNRWLSALTLHCTGPLSVNWVTQRGGGWERALGLDGFPSFNVLRVK